MNVKRVIIVILALAVLSFVLVESLILYNSTRDTIEGEYDHIIVLGAKVDGDTVSLSLKYRLDSAIEYMNRDKEIDVVVTGAKGYNEDYTEASVMKAYLIENGISKDRIIVEDKSFSTFENLKNSYDILGKSKVLIATNDFHMFRSLMLANRVGFEAYPLNARTPRVVALQLYIREYFAFLKSFILDR